MAERIPSPDEDDADMSFDVAELESPTMPPPAPPGAVIPPLALEEPVDETPPVPEADSDKVKARILQLVEENTSKPWAGRSQPTSLGAVRPEHFGAVELKRAAEAPINWVAKGLWTERAKILLASEPKAGKTFFCCEIAMAVSSGDMLFGKIEIVRPGPVGIIAAEDDEGEIGRRFDRMCRAKGKLMSGLDIHWWPGDSVRLNRPRDIDWIRQQIEKYDIKLMIYDPLSRLMDGDENSKECVSGVLNPASTLVRDLGCSVLLVHHLGKDNPDVPKTAAQRVRGSSDIRSWYTTGIFLSGQLDQGKVNVETEQRVRGKLPGEFPVRAVEVEEQSIYGLGTIKLVAELEKRGADGTNEQLIESAAKRILDLAKNKAAYGLSVSEIGVHLRLGRQLTSAAIKRLVREEGELTWEPDKDVPDGKVLILPSGGKRGPTPSPGTSPGASRQLGQQTEKQAPPPPPDPPKQQDIDEDEENLFG